MDCVFCDRSQFEERLCGETKDFWIIATLGQITDGGYVLLAPKRHVECVGAMREPEIDSLNELLFKTRNALINEYSNRGIVFEHGIVCQTIKHAHLHLLPGTIDTLNVLLRIVQDFPPQKYLFSTVPSLTNLQSMYKDKPLPYLLGQDIMDSGFVICWNPLAPPQYLRIVVAEVLDRPERANWRTMDPEFDKKLWSETVKRLKPYFK